MVQNEKEPRHPQRTPGLVFHREGRYAARKGGGGRQPQQARWALAAVSAVTAVAAEFRQTSQSHAGSQLEPESEASQSQPRLQQHLQPHEEHPQPQFE